MALYRVLRALRMGDNKTIPAGDFVIGSSYAPKSLETLEEVGAIAMLYAPPLAELPYFDDQAEQLAKIGIVSADQFLECNIDETSKLLNVDVKTLRTWYAEVANWLIVPAHSGGG